jgi:hypothetical protein
MSTRKRTTMYFEPGELENLRTQLKVNTDAEAVRKAIQLTLQSLAYEGLRSFMGSEKGRPVVDVPRRRESAARKPVAAAKPRPRAKKSA